MRRRIVLLNGRNPGGLDAVLDRTTTLPPLIDTDLVVHLLTDALALQETDPTAARRNIVRARQIALGQDTAPPAYQGGLADWQMRRIAGFVHTNLSTKFGMGDVAQTLKLSVGHLSRAFKATTGIVYSEFVLNARIDLAKWLLLTTDMAIPEIALACGLSDQAHLTRAFKRTVGLPPRAWRRQLGCTATERGQGVGADAVQARADGPASALGTPPTRIGAWIDPHVLTGEDCGFSHDWAQTAQTPAPPHSNTYR